MQLSDQTPKKTVVYNESADTQRFIQGLHTMGLRASFQESDYVALVRIDPDSPIPSFMDWIDKKYQDGGVPEFKVSRVSLEHGFVALAMVATGQ